MEYITLSNGVKMPQLGYGVYQVTKDECECCVLDALEVGYRSIDTAQSYFNEEEVGAAIEKSGIDRKEIFLTSKVWIEHFSYEECKKSVLESMEKLRTDYLDLMLLHQPFGDTYGAWRALEELYDAGKLRAIGISNHYVDRMVEFANFTRIRPMVNQMEVHPLNQQQELKKWADKYGKTTAQVMLRWHIQRGVIVIPKSVHKERMIENFNVFDFTLSEEDMKKIAQLDTTTSTFFSHQDPAMIEWFVKMVEERKTKHDSSKEKKNW